MNRILVILALLSCIYTLYDLWFVEKRMDRRWKIVWSIVAVLFSLIAAGVYFGMVKKRDS